MMESSFKLTNYAILGSKSSPL